MKNKILLCYVKILVLSGIISIVYCCEGEHIEDNNIEYVMDRMEIDVIREDKISFCDIECSEISEESKEYYENLKSIIIASGVYKTSVANKESTNSIVKFLRNIEIELDNGKLICFYDLPEKQRTLFLEYWATMQSYALTNKAKYIPDVRKEVDINNMAFKRVFSANGIIKGSNNKNCVNADKLISEVSKELNDGLMFEYDINEGNLKAKLFNGEIDTKFLKNALKESNKKGCLIIAMPNHYDTDCYVNLKRDRFNIGHAAIIIKDNTILEPVDTMILSVGTWFEEGVTLEKLSHWSVRCYILGIKKLKWGWSDSWSKDAFSRRTLYLNTENMIEKAVSYVGTQYCPVSYYVVSKWVVPKYFTCTTFVWYCIKEAYNIELGPWYTSFVSPRSMILDDNTYILNNIDDPDSPYAD